MAWDYVVVGAGEAGTAVAAGLAADGHSSILLLDSGGYDGGARCPAVRPHVLEFDAWAASGASGWSPEDVLPHFKRVETDLEFGGAGYHGTAGPLVVRRTPEPQWTALDAAFREAALEMGHPWAPDHNAPGVLGVSPLAWMEAAPRPKPGVTVARAGVDRLVWDGARATGVLAVADGSRQRIEAGEVVLCAGGIGSPAILQRSGVGPADVLRAAGIGIRLDLPVGEGLQTHASLDLAWAGGWDPSAERRPVSDRHPSGDRHSSDNPPAQSGIRGASAGSAEDGAAPSFGLIARWNTGLEGTTSGDLMAWTVNASSHDPWVDSAPGPHRVHRPATSPRIVGALAQAFSRGRVSISTADPGAAPAVDPAMLSHPLDRTRFRLLYRHLCDLASRPALRRLAGPPLDAVGDAWRFDREGAALDDWAAGMARGAGYFSSTCRMGSAGEPGVVVDPAGRVHGAEGVRVADGSVMPHLVKAHPALMEAVIGRRMAELMSGRPAPRLVGTAH